jgi:prephenate dehydrogenase
MKIGVVGLGLLGGSFSLSIREKFPEVQIYGSDINPLHAEKAVELGLADSIQTLEELARSCDLLILATPVNVLLKQLPAVLDLINPESIVMDLGSTKEALCKIVENHPKRGRFVAAHPIAGTENSGPEAAFASLVKDKIMILCDRNLTDQDAYSMVEDLSNKLEMRVSHMGSMEHDRHIAYVSHLSHISSFALGSTVLDKEKDEKSIFLMAGSGFSSTVRLAKSSSKMWTPIFSQNRENVLNALDSYIQKLQFFREIISNNREEETSRLIDETNDIRRVLAGIDKS